MNRLKNIFSTLLGVLMMVACQKESEQTLPQNAPEACIDETEEVLYAGMPINFTASCCKNATSFIWDFGDGITSEDAGSSHTYEEAGDYSITLKVENETGASDITTKSITVKEEKEIPTFYHRLDITEDEIWEFGIHVISWSFEIIDAKITIMPGAVIKFSENERFSISGANGAIVANGTETQPIIFTANSNTPVAGYYFGITINGASSQTSLTNCIFEYGGGNYDYGTVLDIKNTTFEFSDNVIRHIKNEGLIIGAGSDIVNFNNNTFIDCGGISLKINGNALHNYGSNNTLDVDERGIVVTSGATLPEVRWRKLSYPYILPGTISIGSEAGTIFTIDPGVTLFCGYRFEFGIDANKKCKVIIEGTESEKITFTSDQDNPQKGDWRGFSFGSGLDSSSSLKFCIVEYPDFVNTTDAAIEIHNTSLNINNCEIRNVDIGFYCTDDGYFQSFDNNTITAELKGFIMHPNRIPSIGNQSVINAPIDVEITDRSPKLTTNAIWPPLTYFINTFFYIESESGSELTLLPGTTIKVQNGRFIYVGRYSNAPGGLKAVGTVEKPIVFTSENDEPQTGDWEHIFFGEGTTIGSTLDNCIVEYAGEMLNKGAVRIENTSLPAIQNTLIRHSADYGVFTMNATPTFNNNSFENNAKADYYAAP